MFLGHGNRFVGGHLHTIGNRCWCGFLAVPTRFHERDDKGKVARDGGKQYLAWLASEEKPDYVNPPVMAEIRGGAGTVAQQPSGCDGANGGSTPPASTKTCNTCNRPFVTRGKVCNRCRQAAYRRRHD